MDSGLQKNDPRMLVAAQASTVPQAELVFSSSARREHSPLLTSLQGLSGKVIIFGGTFDPPHRGHMVLACEAQRLYPNATLIFVPTAQNPLKQKAPIASASERVQMLCAAVMSHEESQTSCAGRTMVCPLQIDGRVGDYSIDFVRALISASPAAEPVLLLGSDCLESIARWRDVEELLSSTAPLIFQRDGEHDSVLSIEALRLSASAKAKLLQGLQTNTAYEFSSTEIRSRRKLGESCSELLPPAVYQVVQERELYRE